MKHIYLSLGALLLSASIIPHGFAESEGKNQDVSYQSTSASSENFKEDSSSGTSLHRKLSTQVLKEEKNEEKKVNPLYKPGGAAYVNPSDVKNPPKVNHSFLHHEYVYSFTYTDKDGKVKTQKHESNVAWIFEKNSGQINEEFKKFTIKINEVAKKQGWKAWSWDH